MAKVYKGAFSGTLPITVSGTGTGVLASYRIFGNDGGVGVETEASGYKLPILSNSTVTDIFIGDTPLAKDEYVDSNTGKIYRRTKNLSPPEEEWIDGQIGGGDGTVSPSTQIKVSPFIDVSTCETCIMEVFSAETEWAAAGYRGMAFYDENKQYLGWIGGGGRQVLTPNSSERLSEFPAGTVYVRIECSHGDQPFYPQLVSGYTPTHHFYPYLVPTDPPAPLPEIPTFAGTTVIDYAGEGLAPSQFDGVAGWGNLPVHQLKGVPYTGTLPATLQTVEGYLESYKIYGDTTQAGTPTPDNPVDVVGCGVRTENLWNFDESAQGDGYVANRLMVNTGTVAGNAFFISEYIPVTSGQSYIYFTDLFRSSQGVIKFYNITNGEVIYLDKTPQKSVPSSVSYSTSECASFTVPTNTSLAVTHIRISVDKRSTMFFIIKSSTAPASYIPYGYKLPLAVNGVEYPIYLGEVETTRKVKKLVLTGEETWYFFNLGEVVWQFYTNNIISGLASSSCMSNIAEYGVTGNTRVDYDYGAYLVSSGRGVAFQMRGSKDTFVDVDAWKVYLAQQYAAGTPVTVWYVLAEPETGIVNEPLMKIGDYADTIDSTQSTVRIPTAAGETTISWAGEGLAPSQFDSIQEWVDKQTYTRVNDEWVADN